MDKVISWDSEKKRKWIEDTFNGALITGVPPNAVMRSVVKRGWCSLYEAQVIFYQALWNRRIRVDLFKPVLPDYPLQNEVVDVFVHYAKWFGK